MSVNIDRQLILANLRIQYYIKSGTSVTLGYWGFNVVKNQQTTFSNLS